MDSKVLVQILSTENLTDLIGNVFDLKIKELKEALSNQSAQTETDDLMTRKEVLELLKINASTLWHYQNKGRIKVYKFSNKCFYKRSELMNDLILLKK